MPSQDQIELKQDLSLCFEWGQLILKKGSYLTVNPSLPDKAFRISADKAEINLDGTIELVKTDLAKKA